MLGKSARESTIHAAQAAQSAQWARAGDELLDLGSRASTLSTIASIEAISAVVHIGHPAQPDPELERLLLTGDDALIITAAVHITPQWVLAARSESTSGTVLADEAGMRDCRTELRALGLVPQVVPTHMPMAERVAIAGPDDLLLVERAMIPVGYTEIALSSRLRDLSELWYGLLEASRGLPSFSDPAQIWLAFGPQEDHEGSLLSTLTVFADHSVDLQHLRSARAASGTHVFLSSFGIPSSTHLRGLLDTLEGRGIDYRILAVIPGTQHPHGPDAINPVWDNELYTRR
ncbi:ACT domain-containing protein [Jonesia denitrificans]|uniref:Uncharacterized protein n=1 Tax=Jonesia denitrificans (strain ATCC 14870 / DSM 20603 / BCRC 15368 / CIP 55.134 / JCM 11481 / NBRC 15587 / NCTC 10816 / Prevot 55134) TaxID=471856 RepID=C7R1Z1_JONDD|nr:hypothetical protein [Jonesia denitrificans]ACV08459.1 hypothetical protein Jden_0797 [Jonesia denitrificans DSM 20603]ASE07895.1 hypothetical protein CEP80_01170 [Jonesia denitrificans]QXB42505.1 hypothetical protein I6L70_08040 [Jonesia denitrificans]SQH20438.1 Uncharacterised protein [Jonesia denitrificans]